MLFQQTKILETLKIDRIKFFSGGLQINRNVLEILIARNIADI